VLDRRQFLKTVGIGTTLIIIPLPLASEILNTEYTLTGLVPGEDRILIAPESNNNIDFGQLSAKGNYNGHESVFTVNELIPDDTPLSGCIRVDCDGWYKVVKYKKWCDYQFIGCEDIPKCSNNANVFVAVIDEVATKETVTFSFQSSRSMIVRVRNGNIVNPNNHILFESFRIFDVFDDSHVSKIAIR